MFISWMFITPSFKKSLIVEQFQGNYLKEKRCECYIKVTVTRIILKRVRIMQNMSFLHCLFAVAGSCLLSVWSRWCCLLHCESILGLKPCTEPMLYKTFWAEILCILHAFQSFVKSLFKLWHLRVTVRKRELFKHSWKLCFKYHWPVPLINILKSENV